MHALKVVKGSLCLEEHPCVILTPCHYPRLSLSSTSYVYIGVYSVGFSRSPLILLNAIHVETVWWHTVGISPFVIPLNYCGACLPVNLAFESCTVKILMSQNFLFSS